MAGVVIAVGQVWWVVVVYLVGTVAAATSCAISFHDMHMADSVATSAFEDLEVSALA